MRNHISLKSDIKKTLRNSSLVCDTNKFETKKNRLCLKCGEKFLSRLPCNRICGKCGLTNKRIGLKTFYAASKHLNKLNH